MSRTIQCGSLYGLNYPIYDALFNHDEDGKDLTKSLKRDLVKRAIKDYGFDKNSKISVIDFMTGDGEYLGEVNELLPKAKLTGVDIALSPALIFKRNAKFIHADAFEYIATLADEIRKGAVDKQFDLGIFACNALVLFIWDDYKDDGPYFDAEVALGKVIKLADDLKVICKNLVLEFQTGVSLEDTVETYMIDLPSDLPFVKENRVNPKGVEFTIEEHFLFHRNAFVWTVEGITSDGDKLVFDSIWRSNIPTPLIYSILVKRYNIEKLYEWGTNKPYKQLKSVNSLVPTQDINLWILKSYEH